MGVSANFKAIKYRKDDYRMALFEICYAKLQQKTNRMKLAIETSSKEYLDTTLFVFELDQCIKLNIHDML